MGVNLEVTADDWDVFDQSWIATLKGRDTMRTGTLDISKFNALHYPKGFIPAGTAVALITSGLGIGKYGPYNNALANGQEVMAGLLFTGVQVIKHNTARTAIGFALFWEGVVKQSKLPVFTGAAASIGTVDAPGKVDVGTNIRWEA